MVVTYRTDPKTFNRFVSSRAPETLLMLLTQSTLVRVNRVTGALEPRLATEWIPSADQLTWTLKLRPDVVFSDGTPFTAADVVFTFEALYDEQVNSPMASAFKVNGKPLTVRAENDRTVVLTFPSPYGPGISILDSLPILPKHKLGAALNAGTFASAWPVTTAPAEIVGTGPFVLAEYVPGQRLRYTRNARFWNRDAEGKPLPRLNEIEVQIAPEQNAEVLRLQNGDIDLGYDAARAEDLSAFRKLETAGSIQLFDAGVGLDPDAFWVNLVPNTPRAKDRPWLQREELRRAISLAVDRQAIVDTVYLGAGVVINSPITPGYGDWSQSSPPPEHVIARAKALLASIGLTDHNRDGMLEDARGKPAKFSILTQKGNSARERTVAVLQQQLAAIGLTVESVPLDNKAAIGQWQHGDYDAMYFGVQVDSKDPARNPDLWTSNGSFHAWNPDQKVPATPWEKTMDELFGRETATLDHPGQLRLFAQVQAIFAEHVPMLYFAAPRVIIPMSTRVRGATPSVIQPAVLWNAEVLSIGPVPVKK